MIAILSKDLVDTLSSDILDQANSTQKQNQPYILDLIDLKRVYLQGLPLEIQVSEETTFATINTHGRNTPFYQPSHGEDTIRFNISWFADIEEQSDVLAKCKWISSLSKIDGYNKSGLHPIALSFGKLFKGSKWIVKSATYSLRLYNRELGMMPRLATQELVLARISDTNMDLKTYRKLDV